MTRFCLVATAGVLAAVSSVSGSGLRIVHQDGFATARGDAFVATADNASAVFYNPAGITQLEGAQARLGAYAVTLQVDHRPPGGGSFENQERLITAPHAYYAWSPKDSPISLGLGVNSPFGLSLDYGDDAPSRDVNKKAKLIVVSIAPVLAWQITDTFSFGAGPTVNLGEAQDRRGLGFPGDGFRFRGSGTAFGFNAGVLWKPAPRHSFGLTYHSAMDFEFSGHSQITVKPTGTFKVRLPEESASISAHLPQFIVAGYSFRPTSEWNLEVNADWTDWDSLNSAPLEQQFSGPGAIVFDWRSGFIYSAGATRTFSGGLHASAGYAFSEANNPESTYTPGVPDGDRHIFSVGLGRRGEHFEWDLGYQYSFSDYRTIDNDRPADGQWRLHSHAIVLSVGYRF